MTHFDALVIGGGPAGLTAALTMARQVHTAAVFDSHEYHNDGTEHIHTLPTWDHKSPAAFRQASRENILNNYDTVTFCDTAVKRVEKSATGACKSQDAFRLVDNDGKSWYGSKVVLASGCIDVYPDIQGYAEAWPSGIFHCLFCHGYEERGAHSSGVLAVDRLAAVPTALHFARSALQLSQTATLYTHGSTKLLSEVRDTVGDSLTERLEIDSRKITRLEKSPHRAEMILHFEDGTSATEAFLSHTPRSALRGPFAEQLGVELTPEGNVRTTTMFNETSVRGVFAAGDIATLVKITPNAILTGNAAGAGVCLQVQADNLGHKPLIGHSTDHATLPAAAAAK
ncbi:MAG: hypothetical protein Q9162_000915 [Coniocarpon cinnabarinum]